MSYSYRFRENVTLGSAAASITFSGLSDLSYQVDGYIVNDANAKTVQLRLNGDTGNNYTRQAVSADGTSVAGERPAATSAVNLETGNNLPSGQSASFSAFISKPATGVKGQVVAQYGGGASPRLVLSGAEWNNTSALVTSIEVRALSNNFAAGTSISVYGASLTQSGGGVGDWTRLATVVLGSAAASVGASGLDTDYRKFRVRLYAIKDGTVNGVDLRLNGDSGTNYARQSISANSTSVTGNRATGATSFLLTGGIAANAPALLAIDVQKPASGVPARVSVQDAHDQAGSGIVYMGHVGEWNNTAALVSQVDVLATTGNLAAGTRLLIAGSKDS